MINQSDKTKFADLLWFLYLFIGYKFQIQLRLVINLGVSGTLFVEFHDAKLHLIRNAGVTCWHSSIISAFLYAVTLTSRFHLFSLNLLSGPLTKREALEYISLTLY
jgi:hypothetical protein